MAFTYALADLGDTTASGHLLAVVRRRLGDTEEAAAIFQDEEIQYQIARYDDGGATDEGLGLALVALIHDLLAWLNRQPDFQRGLVESINWRRSAEYWRRLEAEIRREYGIESSISSTGFQVGRDDLTEGEDYYYENFGNRRSLGSTRVVGRAQ